MATRVPDRSSRRSALTPILVLACVVPLMAQQGASTGRVYTADDYARAERLMGYNTNPLVFHGAVRPNWLAPSSQPAATGQTAAGADDRFWYRVSVPGGAEFVLVTDTQIYRIDNQQLPELASFASRRVQIKGKLDGDRIVVASMNAAND